VFDGVPHVFFVDAANGNTLTDWAWNSSTGWQQVFLYGHSVTAGASPSAIMSNGTPHVYFSDAANSNSVTDFSWNSTAGWQQAFLYGDSVAGGTSPAG
jgi:hypothetical protein